MLHLAVALLSGALVLGAPAPERIDLAKRYPATLTWSQSGLAWVSDREDVYRVASFEFARGRDLAVECGGATLVLGRHGSNVLWAALFPDAPATVRSKLAGEREQADELFLRFSPKDVGELFAAKTVEGPGDASKRAHAARLFRGKLGWDYFTPSGNTTVLPEGTVVVDFDAEGGKRRCFVVERRKVRYLDEFESRPMPPLVPIDEAAAHAAFEQVWAAFEGEYAGFVRHPELDWRAHGRELEPRVRAARTTLDLAAVLADGLAVLEDLHVWVQIDGLFVPGYDRERVHNANRQGVEAAFGELQALGGQLAFASTPEGIGYVAVDGLGDSELPARFDEALEALAGTWALVLDLRSNGGGDERLAQRIAGRFLEQETAYAKNRFRNGPAAGDLGPALERRVGPRGPWRYTAPVWVLQGARTMSSAESFVQMLAQAPNVTTAGASTAGSSGNPRRLALDIGIVVNLPRWLDLDLADRPIEGVGVPPDELLEFPADAFAGSADPLIEAVLARLRRTPAKERTPGRP